MAMFFLPPLYILSSGPATRLLEPKVWERVYYPMRYIHRIAPGPGKLLDDYDNWWASYWN